MALERVSESQGDLSLLVHNIEETRDKIIRDCGKDSQAAMIVNQIAMVDLKPYTHLSDPVNRENISNIPYSPDLLKEMNTYLSMYNDLLSTDSKLKEHESQDVTLPVSYLNRDRIEAVFNPYPYIINLRDSSEQKN